MQQRVASTQRGTSSRGTSQNRGSYSELAEKRRSYNQSKLNQSTLSGYINADILKYSPKGDFNSTNRKKSAALRRYLQTPSAIIVPKTPIDPISCSSSKRVHPF
jgi:hypothetical protein